MAFDKIVTLSDPAIDSQIQHMVDHQYRPSGGEGQEQRLICTDLVSINFGSIPTAYITLDRATTTIFFENAVDGQVCRIRLTQDGAGSRAVTWGTTVRWKGGSNPVLTTTASKADWITLIKSNGEWYGDIIKNF